MNIELEITLRCNASCPSCSRHTREKAYRDSDMSIEQIQKFISEVKERNDIDLISVMGGEPTIHPQFETIMMLLYSELIVKKHIKRLQIITNGKIKVKKEISDIIATVVSPQEVKGMEHRCQFVSPSDTGQELKDYCEVPYICGVSLNRYGYAPCGAGGAIARLFGLSRYIRYSLPKTIEEFGNLMEICACCQVKAKNIMFVKQFGDIQSISYRKAFEKLDNLNNAPWKEY